MLVTTVSAMTYLGLTVTFILYKLTVIKSLCWLPMHGIVIVPVQIIGLLVIRTQVIDLLKFYYNS